MHLAPWKTFYVLYLISWFQAANESRVGIGSKIVDQKYLLISWSLEHTEVDADGKIEAKWGHDRLISSDQGSKHNGFVQGSKG